MPIAFAEMPLFAGLDAEGVAALARMAVPFSTGARAVVFQQGDEPDGLYLVADGTITLSSRAPGDEANSLVSVEAGGFLGELALLDGGRRSATAIAETDSSGWRLPADRLEAMVCDGRPAAVETMARIRAGVAGRIRDTIAAIAQLPAEAGVSGVREAGLAGPPAAPDPDSDAAAMLSGLTAFAPLGSAGCTELASLGECVRLPKGRLISKAGGSATHLHIVLRGALGTALAREQGCEQLLVHGPGDLVGLLALMDGGALASELMVREDARLLRIERSVFMSLANDHPELHHRLHLIANRQLVRDLRRLTRHLGRARGLMAFNAQGGQD